MLGFGGMFGMGKGTGGNSVVGRDDRSRDGLCPPVPIKLGWVNAPAPECAVLEAAEFIAFATALRRVRPGVTVAPAAGVRNSR